MTNSFRSQSRFCNFFEFYPFILTKAASDSTNKLSIELIISNNALVFKAATVVFLLFLYRFHHILKNNLVCDLRWLSFFELLAQMIFKCCRSSVDAELVRGSWSNQEPLLLSARRYIFSLKEWCSYFLLWASFFFLFTLGLFLLLIFP